MKSSGLLITVRVTVRVKTDLRYVMWKNQEFCNYIVLFIISDILQLLSVNKEEKIPISSETRIFKNWWTI